MSLKTYSTMRYNILNCHPDVVFIVPMLLVMVRPNCWNKNAQIFSSFKNIYCYLFFLSLNPEVKMNIAGGRNSCSIYYNSQAIKLNMLFIVFLIVNPISVLICRLACAEI